MPVMYEIRFLPEGLVRRFAGSRGNYYELADGSHLDVHTKPVWCKRCGRVRHGEMIPTLQELDQQLADLDNPGSDLYRRTMMPLLPEFEPPDFRENFRRECIEETRKRRQWRLSRRSPAKCIHCGSSDIISLPIDQPVAVSTDPKPLSLVVSRIGMCDTNFNEWFFTTEGDRIPRDTKPARWHHPVLDREPGRFQEFLKRLRGNQWKSGRGKG